MKWKPCPKTIFLLHVDSTTETNIVWGHGRALTRYSTPIGIIGNSFGLLFPRFWPFGIPAIVRMMRIHRHPLLLLFPDSDKNGGLKALFLPLQPLFSIRCRYLLYTGGARSSVSFSTIFKGNFFVRQIGLYYPAITGPHQHRDVQNSWCWNFFIACLENGDLVAYNGLHKKGSDNAKLSGQANIWRIGFKAIANKIVYTLQRLFASAVGTMTISSSSVHVLLNQDKGIQALSITTCNDPDCRRRRQFKFESWWNIAKQLPTKQPCRYISLWLGQHRCLSS